ncbi:hypothetical protein PIROE2DRAFT_2527 [Piromyces sp. E2]|nr:hypothetical protein PIROE2DRAFT_2527 [Piromyces sp. E2]|eukprot:OUM69441.1 hypothetical protein PIROE2DRAFT_2527 [Piromyces sp. E2]
MLLTMLLYLDPIKQEQMELNSTIKLNISPLSTKCALAQNRCFEKYIDKSQIVYYFNTADNYIGNKFEVTKDYYKLNLEFPQYTKGFHWLLKTDCGYKLDRAILKAAKLVNGVKKIIVNKVLNISLYSDLHLMKLDSEISNNSDSVNEYLSVNNLSVNNLNQIENVPKYLISILGGRHNNNRNKTEWENL